ncbi:MAG: hypothetical protein ACXVI9_00085 [Mucilaginibacter sp.]
MGENKASIQMMDTIEIDDLARDFYKAISFSNEHAPDLDPVKILFFGEGALVNTSFLHPLGFTVESFVTSLESEIAEGNMSQFIMKELKGKTQVFGKLAQRISVYEYNLGEETSGRLPRGVNYMQFVRIDGNWRILSVAWCDENEDNIIPAEYLR